MHKLTLRIRTNSRREVLRLLRDAYREIKATGVSASGHAFRGGGSDGPNHQDEWDYEQTPGPVKKIKGICA